MANANMSRLTPYYVVMIPALFQWSTVILFCNTDVPDLFKMRKIVFESSVSLDGFIEGPNGELDWLVFDYKPANVSKFLSVYDTIFYGRKTYETLTAKSTMERVKMHIEWPVHDALYGMRKYVFSRTEKHVEGNAMVVGDNLEAEVQRIREEQGKHIWFCGGADILKTFMKLDLVDEYVLSIHPIVLMAGKPLFPERQIPVDLKLVAKCRMPSGVVILHYKPENRVNLSL